MNKYTKTKCAICDDYDNYKVLYKDTTKSDDLNVKIFSARRLPDRIHYQIVRCNKDGLLRSNPIGDTDKLLSLYTESKFTYQEEVDNLTKTYIDSLKKILKNIKKSDNILEIGCGNGFVLNALYKMGYINVFGIEPSIDAIKNASPTVKKRIKRGLLDNNSLPRNKFKLIFFFQTFDHIPDPNKFLQTCHNLLQKNGYILSFNHNTSSLSAKIFGERCPIFDIEHTYLYNTKTMKLVFEKNGFETLSSKSINNTISLRHLLWLLPIPKNIKLKLYKNTSSILEIKLNLPLGNLCYTGKKHD